MGQVLAGNGGVARPRSRRDDDLVEWGEVGRRGLHPEPQGDAAAPDHGGVPGDEGVEFLLAGDGAGEVELAADPVLAFEEGDAVAAGSRLDRGSEPGGAGADDGHRAGPCCGGGGNLGLVAGAGIDEAGGQAACEGMVEAGLVAGDAGGDLVGAPCARLGHEIGIGEEGARHAHHVGRAVGKDRFGDLGRIDAVGGDERHPDLAHELARDPGKGAARDGGRDGGDARLVPADAGVDHRRAGGGDGAGEQDDLVMGGAVGDEVDHREAEDDDEVGAGGGAGAAHDLDGQAHAVVVSAAPAVGAAVGMGDEELVEQIALGAHDLDPVIAGFAGAGGGGGDVGDLLLDPRLVEFAGGEGADR